MNRIVLLALLSGLAACGQGETAPKDTAQPEQVATSGKTKVPLDQVPAEVLQAAMAAQPGITLSEAEAETRDGRRYYDIGGTLADGSEVEFDIMEEGGSWQVVETQRDIAFSAAPAQVREASARADAQFTPTRVIESTQQDGIVIYELFGPAGSDPQGRKVEVKWEGRQAEILTKEWAH